MRRYTDLELEQMCMAYLAEIFEKGKGSQAEILNSANRIRGFVDAAQEFQGMSDDRAEGVKRQIMMFAMLHEDRLQPKPETRGGYLL